MTDVVNLSRRSFFRGVGALGAMALTGRQVQLKAQGPTPLQAPDGVADWPEWRGRGRLGVWTESGILDRFPASGLQVVWRTPVHGGYAGPAVTGGRVFVADYAPTRGLRGVERILSLDAGTGRTLWSREWDTSYIGMLDTWAIGPAATPTVDGDRVYVLGRAGALFCLNAGTGDVVWQKDYMKDYGAEMPTWGFTGAPLVDGNRLVCLVGGAPDAKVVAFDKMTGKEIWRALPSESELGYAQPIIISAGGARQLIIWHPGAVGSLDPVTGQGHWEQPYKVSTSMTVADAGAGRLAAARRRFYNGSLHADPGRGKPAATRPLEGQERQRSRHRRTALRRRDAGDRWRLHLRAVQLRPVPLSPREDRRAHLGDTGGDRERARWASGQIVRQGNRFFINNDRGELIIARLSPKGYEEISRTTLLKPTSNPGNRRELWRP